MKKKFSLEEIKDFWSKRAVQYGASHRASWSDRMAIELEIRQINRYLSNGNRVLDVGCANGYSTIRFALRKKINIKGNDYIPQMIKEARSRLDRIKESLAGRVEFAIGDITALNEPDDLYDIVIVTRVLINLGTWDKQLKALHECARVLKKGGTLLLSEATLQGWNAFNGCRRKLKLPNIPMHPFNQYIDQEKVIGTVAPYLKLIKVVNFSSTYYFGTRILKPFVIKLLRLNIDVANPESAWNIFFARLPSLGRCGTQKLIVLEKK